MDAPDVAILVVNWNTCSRLRRCLRALGDLPDPVRREVVVVDNGSDDGSAEMIASEFATVRLIRNGRNEGFARAVNQGIAASRAPCILLLNSDAELQPGALEALARHLGDHPDVAAAGAQLYKPDGRRQHSFDVFPSLTTELVNKGILRRLFPRRYPSRLQASDGPVDVDSLIGACMMVRRSAVEAVGGFDGRFFVFYEETDWCRRARRDGWRIMLVPAAGALHAQGETKARHPGRARVEYWRSKYAYFDKHQGRSARLALAGLSFVRLTLQVLTLAVASALTGGLWPAARRRLSADAWLWAWHALGTPRTMGFAPSEPVPGYLRVRTDEGFLWLTASSALALRGSGLARLADYLDTPAAVLVKEGRNKRHYRVTLAHDGAHQEWVVKVYKRGGLAARLKAALRGGKALRELKRMAAAERRGIDVSLPVLAGAWTSGRRAGEGCLVFKPLDGWTSLDARLRETAGAPPGGEPRESVRERRETIRAFGLFARRIYDAGVDQDDFNPTNVYVRREEGRPRFLLLDFERVRIRPVVPRNRRIWTSAKMGRVPAWASRTDRFRFLRGLLPANVTREERRAFSREWAAAWDRVRERDRLRGKHTGPDAGGR